MLEKNPQGLPGYRFPWDSPYLLRLYLDGFYILVGRWTTKEVKHEMVFHVFLECNLCRDKAFVGKKCACLSETCYSAICPQSEHFLNFSSEIFRKRRFL